MKAGEQFSPRKAKGTKMATIQQILANRANASLSTGPRTAGGIEATKYNATRHGLAGNQIVTKGEDPAAYDELRRQLVADHAPANEREAMLVEEIAQNWWRLERARRVEAAVIQKFGELECIVDPEARKAFQTISRYLNAIQRTWHRACRDLEVLQDKRRQQLREQAKSAAVRPQLVPSPPKMSAIRRRFIRQSAPFRKQAATPQIGPAPNATHAGLA